MAGLCVVTIWCLTVVVVVVMTSLMVPVGAGIVCPTTRLSHWPPQPLHLDTTSEGQLEADLNLHPPPSGNTTWGVLFALRKRNKNIRVADGLIKHTKDQADGEVLLEIKCYSASDDDDDVGDEEDDSTSTVVQLPTNATQSPVPHSLKLQVLTGQSWMALTDNTTGQRVEVLRHDCTANLTDFPDLELGVQCPEGVEECGSVRVCRNECRARRVPYLPPLPLELLTTSEGQLEAEFNLHPPSNNISWGVYMGFRKYPSNTLVAWVGIGHTPGQDKEDRLAMGCFRARDYTTIPEPWPLNTSSLSTPRTLNLKVGLAWLEVTDTTAGQKHATLRHNCTTDLAQFPHLHLSVKCTSGVSDCGLVSSSCSVDSNKTKVPSTTPHPLKLLTTNEGHLETDIHIHPPADNTSWGVWLIFKTQDGDIQVADVVMSYTVGQDEEDLLRMECHSVRDLAGVWDPWSLNTTYLTAPRTIKLQVGSAWVAVTDKTAGQNQVTLRHNCTANLTQFPHLQLSVECTNGVSDCGAVSSWCREEAPVWKQLPLPTETLARLVVKMVFVEAMVALLLGAGLTWLWLHYLRINLLHHLAPLLTCPPPPCRSPPSTTHDDTTHDDHQGDFQAEWNQRLSARDRTVLECRTALECRGQDSV